MRRAWFLIAVVGCGRPGTSATREKGEPQQPEKIAAAPAAALQCEELPFAASTPVREASGAAWMMIDGALALVVTSDSGGKGAYSIVDPETGATRETGSWPLGDASDDVEGLAARGDKLYGLTSAGWMRVWERRDKGFALVDGPYPLGPVDLPDTASRLGNDVPTTAGMVCGAKATNCGRNYEGLCLPAKPSGPCVGFAAAKADGHLYCLVADGARLAVRHDPSIAIAQPGVMADCAFDDTDRLWVGANLFGLSQVYQVTGWQDPKAATVTVVASLGVGFPEVIAGRGDVIYRMSDTGGSPSGMAKFRCRAPQASQ